MPMKRQGAPPRPSGGTPSPPLFSCSPAKNNPSTKTPARGKNQVAIKKTSGGRASRQKGDRAERALVRQLQDAGFGAERVPLSGSAGGSFSGDVSCPLLGVDRRLEVKIRGNGFRELYSWIEGRDALIVRSDRREPLIVIRASLALEVMIAAEKARTS